ncbi:hypothetical protein CQA89_33265, partial [Klebsiella pneumoniae]
TTASLDSYYGEAMAMGERARSPAGLRGLWPSGVGEALTTASLDSYYGEAMAMGERARSPAGLRGLWPSG